MTILTELSEAQPKAGIPIVKVGTGSQAKATGLLADIAPTCLGLMGVDTPANMTGVDIRNML